jgi:hypothetical protein
VRLPAMLPGGDFTVARSRYATGVALLRCRYLVDALDRDQVAFDDVQDAVRTDAEPVVAAAMKAISGIRVLGEGADGVDDGAHSGLVMQVTAG